MPAHPPARRAPSARLARASNRAVAALIRVGVSPAGAQTLRVRGRSTGAWREVPVNPHAHEGGHYLVAPRGETQWVRNLRAAGSGELVRGRRVVRFTAAELADDDKPGVLRSYLRRWRFEVKRFFPGLDGDSPEEAFRATASAYPVFRIAPEGPGSAPS